MPPKTKLSTEELSFIGVMTSLSVATNYLMLSLTNVKLMDLFVFVSGYLRGPLVGVLVGCFTWLIYGTLNPYGFSLPILIATMSGESIYGIIGGLSSHFRIFGDFGFSSSFKGDVWSLNFKFAILGFFCTFIYDLYTNIISGLVSGLPIVAALILGIPFSLIHEVSNLILFFFGASILIGAIHRFTSKKEVSMYG